MADVLLRPATLADANDLARLHTQGWQQGYRGMLPDAYLDAIDPSQAQRRWQHSLANPSELQIIVACDPSDRPVGFASVGLCFDDDCTDERWELWDLWVDAEHRGRGIGGQLLTAALAEVPPDVDVTVWVLDANHAAQRFYESHGAVRDNRVRLSGRNEGVAIRDLRWRWHRGPVASDGRPEAGNPERTH